MKPKRRKLEKLVGWGDPQDESNDGGFNFEVVTGLGVGNLPNNQNINVGVGLEVGNSFGVGRNDTGKGLVLEQRWDLEIKNKLRRQ